MTPFTKTIIVPAGAIDDNGHVNNIVYVSWMQDVATEHYRSIGGMELQGPGAGWVVREHRIRYLLPAFEGEEIEMRTWIADFRKVRSQRNYEFVRRNDSKLIATGETDWVFVDVATGRPRSVPPDLAAVFAPPGLNPSTSA